VPTRLNSAGLRIAAEAMVHSINAGHCPGPGEEDLTEIADHFPARGI
jgi:hypothetical protein